MGEGKMERVIVCRCEDVYLDDVETSLADADGPISAHELKLQTRAGMGVCQGRTCGPLIHSLLRSHSAVLGDAEIGPASNPPARPMTLMDLAASKSNPESRSECSEANK
ncbi:(2Fe-2S)-binding protein [Arthrobacter terricola]|uniref:(2Fe-2S)-binding protein n=2 Tax=Arthrobacter TaxID=1663 RepID=A0A4R5K5V9_9MICC|nr:(2Fe-2S)-binding protein [Arthrobacter terricola]